MFDDLLALCHSDGSTSSASIRQPSPPISSMMDGTSWMLDGVFTWWLLQFSSSRFSGFSAPCWCPFFQVLCDCYCKFTPSVTFHPLRAWWPAFFICSIPSSLLLLFGDCCRHRHLHSVLRAGFPRLCLWHLGVASDHPVASMDCMS